MLDSCRQNHEQTIQSLGMHPMPFQKGTTIGLKGPMRHDTTIELVTQLTMERSAPSCTV
jgi:hypothetical protein